MESVFEGCTSLKTVVLTSLCFPDNAGSMFYGCTSLTYVTCKEDGKGLHLTNATNTGSMFEGCSSLKSVGELDTVNATEMSKMFLGCTSLRKIGGLSIRSTTSSPTIILFNAGQLEVLWLKDIGYNSNTTSVALTTSSLSNWGIAGGEYGEEAAASLRESLCELSFDRTAAGYETCTIQLHADVKARLTETEIAQITAKGYTIA